MQMQKKKVLWIKWLVVSFCLTSLVVAISIFVFPTLFFEKSITQKAVLLLENRLPSSAQTGTVSYHWPNQIHVSYIILQKQNSDQKTTTQFDDIQGTLKLFPLLWNQVIFQKIEVKQINYENSLLIEDLFTDTLSLKDGVITTHAQFKANGGKTYLHGVIELNRDIPEFNITIKAHDVYITQEMPVLRDLPLFKNNGSEAGGILNIEGYLAGKGFGRNTLNKDIKGNFTLSIRNGYIKSNVLFSALSEIITINDFYSFDLLETEVRIKDETMYTPKAIVDSKLLKMEASGMIGFGGKLFYKANITVNERFVNKDIEKITGTAFRQNAIPLEIRGDINNPKISIKLSQENVEQLVRGIVNDFLRTDKEAKKEGKAGGERP